MAKKPEREGKLYIPTLDQDNLLVTQLRETHKPDLGSLVALKYAAVAVVALTEAAEIQANLAYTKATTKAVEARRIYLNTENQPDTYTLTTEDGLKDPTTINTSIAGSNALEYAHNMRANIKNTRPDLVKKADELGAQGNDDIIQEHLRGIAIRELGETAEDLARTPLTDAKRILQDSASGRLSDEHMRAVMNYLPSAARIALKVVLPKVVEDGIYQVLRTLKENPDEITEIINDPRVFGNMIDSTRPYDESMLVGQLTGRYNDVKREDAVLLLDAMAASYVLANYSLLQHGEKPNEYHGLALQYAKIAGVVNKIQSQSNSERYGTGTRQTRR